MTIFGHIQRNNLVPIQYQRDFPKAKYPVLSLPYEKYMCWLRQFP